MKDFITKTDHYFTELFHRLYIWGGDATNVIMRLISFIGELGAIFLLIGFGLALFKRTRKIGGTIILSIAIGFVISNLLLKNMIQRVRPFQATAQYELWWAGTNGKFESGYSFPSGHVTAAMAFAMAVCLTTNKKRNWPIMFLPIIMAISRIYLMVHYFTDCLGGMVVGLVSGVIAYLLLNWIYKSKIKLFVWVRELDLFGPKKKKSKSEPKKIKQEPKKEKPKPVKQESVNPSPAIPEFYIPQSEEKNEETSFIKKITKDEETDESNTDK